MAALGKQEFQAQKCAHPLAERLLENHLLVGRSHARVTVKKVRRLWVMPHAIATHADGLGSFYFAAFIQPALRLVIFGPLR